jgi:exonuclease III
MMTRSLKTKRLAAAGLASTMAATLFLSFANNPAEAAITPTPDRQIVTVIANLNKAYGGSYTGPSLGNMDSVRAFANRALAMTPTAPDVVLLQEVRAKSAKAAATALTNKSPFKYVVVVMPGQHPTREFGGMQIHKETAIILNTDTMEKIGTGGFLAAKYTRAQAAAGHKIKVKKTAYIGATQRSSGMKVALASVHYTPIEDLKSKALSNSLRGKWSEQIAAKLKSKYPGSAITNIGGDFNQIRCYSGAFKSCTLADFWKYFSNNGFVDSLYMLHQASPGPEACVERTTGVDYIFSDGNPKKGGVDSKGGYSDHKLRWVTIEAVPYKKC